MNGIPSPSSPSYESCSPYSSSDDEESGSLSCENEIAASDENLISEDHEVSDWEGCFSEHEVDLQDIFNRLLNSWGVSELRERLEENLKPLEEEINEARELCLRCLRRQELKNKIQRWIGIIEYALESDELSVILNFRENGYKEDVEECIEGANARIEEVREKLKNSISQVEDLKKNLTEEKEQPKYANAGQHLMLKQLQMLINKGYRLLDRLEQNCGSPIDSDNPLEEMVRVSDLDRSKKLEACDDHDPGKVQEIEDDDVWEGTSPPFTLNIETPFDKFNQWLEQPLWEEQENGERQVGNIRKCLCTDLQGVDGWYQQSKRRLRVLTWLWEYYSHKSTYIPALGYGFASSKDRQNPNIYNRSQTANKEGLDDVPTKKDILYLEFILGGEYAKKAREYKEQFKTDNAHGRKSSEKLKKLENEYNQHGKKNRIAVRRHLGLIVKTYGLVKQKIGEMQQAITESSSPKKTSALSQYDFDFREIRNNGVVQSDLLSIDLTHRAEVVQKIVEICQEVSLKNIKVYCAEQSPNLSIEILFDELRKRQGGQFWLKKNKKIKDKNLAEATKAWVNICLSFFGAILNQCSQDLNLSVHTSRRQSFGFLRPTIAEVAPSIRLSVGCAPLKFSEVVVNSIQYLDMALTKITEADNPVFTLGLLPIEGAGAGEHQGDFFRASTRESGDLIRLSQAAIDYIDFDQDDSGFEKFIWNEVIIHTWKKKWQQVQNKDKKLTKKGRAALQKVRDDIVAKKIQIPDVIYKELCDICNHNKVNGNAVGHNSKVVVGGKTRTSHNTSSGTSKRTLRENSDITQTAKRPRNSDYNPKIGIEQDLLSQITQNTRLKVIDETEDVDEQKLLQIDRSSMLLQLNRIVDYLEKVLKKRLKRKRKLELEQVHSSLSNTFYHSFNELYRAYSLGKQLARYAGNHKHSDEMVAHLYSKAHCLIETILENIIAMKSTSFYEKEAQIPRTIPKPQHDKHLQNYFNVRYGLENINEGLFFRTISGQSANSLALGTATRIAFSKNLEEVSDLGTEEFRELKLYKYGDPYYEIEYLIEDLRKGRKLKDIRRQSKGNQNEKKVIFVDPCPTLAACPSPKDQQQLFNPNLVELIQKVEHGGVLIVDVTNVYLFSDKMDALINAWKGVQDRWLILTSSLLKNEQMGADKFQAGRIIILRPNDEKIHHSQRIRFSKICQELEEISNASIDDVQESFFNTIQKLLYPITKSSSQHATTGLVGSTPPKKKNVVIRDRITNSIPTPSNQSSTSSQEVSPSSSSQSYSNLAGMKNKGDDCFFNAVTQLIFHSRLRDFFNDHSNVLGEKHDNRLFTFYTVLQTQLLFAQGEPVAYDSQRMRKLLAFEPGQHDCVEAFNRICANYNLNRILSTFEIRRRVDLDSRIPYQGVVDDSGRLRDPSIPDAEGGFVNQESMTMLPITLGVLTTMQELVEDVFREKTIHDKFSFAYENQDWQVGSFTERTEPTNLLSTIILHIQRFRLDGSKIETSLPADLYHIQIQGRHYSLKGFIVHQGSGSTHGHYFTCFLVNGIWYKFNDTRVTHINSSPSITCPFHQDALKAYVLYYEENLVSS